MTRQPLFSMRILMACAVLQTTSLRSQEPEQPPATTFSKPVAVRPPQVRQAERVRNPIDQFVFSYTEYSAAVYDEPQTQHANSFPAISVA